MNGGRPFKSEGGWVSRAQSAEIPFPAAGQAIFFFLCSFPGPINWADADCSILSIFIKRTPKICPLNLDSLRVVQRFMGANNQDPAELPSRLPH